jgi:hypothetical protein
MFWHSETFGKSAFLLQAEENKFPCGDAAAKTRDAVGGEKRQPGLFALASMYAMHGDT